MNWFRRDKKTKPEDDPTHGQIDPATGQEVAKLASNDAGSAREIVLRDTRDKLNKFKMLCAFFNHQVLRDILEQTELVFAIFEKNAELNHRKLEQYNYMYTDNLIALLSKLKKSREENIIILNEKLLAASRKISQIDVKKIDHRRHANEQKKYAATISYMLVTSYRELAGGELPTGRGDTRHVTAPQYYINIMPDTNVYAMPEPNFDALCDYDEKDYYHPTLFLVQRKLMGKLNKSMFGMEFLYTFKCGDLYLYVFKISDTTDYFIFVPHKSLFRLVNSTEILCHVVTANSSWGKLASDYEEILERHERLQQDLSKQKSLHEAPLIEVLQKYLDKINEQELTNGLEEIDGDRRFLEEMLKLQKFDV